MTAGLPMIMSRNDGIGPSFLLMIMGGRGAA